MRSSMGQWISLHGKLYPANEKVALRNNSKEKIINPSASWSKYAGEEVGPGEPFIYEGPDRASLFELYLADPTGKTEYLGMEFYDDPEIQDRARQRGYKSVADYAKAMGYDKTKAEERFKGLVKEISTHDLPKTVKMLRAAESGGYDTSGQGNDAYGDFGDPPFKPN